VAVLAADKLGLVAVHGDQAGPGVAEAAPAGPGVERFLVGTAGGDVAGLAAGEAGGGHLAASFAGFPQAEYGLFSKICCELLQNR
jgi:hypothetical protein